MGAKAIIDDLMRAKAAFQQRAIEAAMGYPIITRTHFDEATGETVMTLIDPADVYPEPPPQAAKE